MFAYSYTIPFQFFYPPPLKNDLCKYVKTNGIIPHNLKSIKHKTIKISISKSYH